MSGVIGYCRRLIPLLVLACACVNQLAPANAQKNKQEKERISTIIATEINREIGKHPTEGAGFREKVVGRLMQCSLIFVMISKQANDLVSRNNISDVADISGELSARVSNGISVDRYKFIADTAGQNIREKFAADRTPETEREMNILLKNCKAFNKIEEIAGAVAALQSSAPPKATAVPVELANELQECSLYYALLAGGLLVQVPQNSKPLSPADGDKVVKSQVYMTKSEQIEVFYKRLARMAGVTESSLVSRREAMFKEEKRIMGGGWNIDRLQERYQDFCEYILSDTGSKGRVEEIKKGNVCGRLYTCW